MRLAQVYHKAGKESLSSILSGGLKYGEQGGRNQEDQTRKTNEFLDRYCPDALRDKGVDRQKCSYCYLYFEERILDVESGGVVEPQRWDVGAENSVLRLAVDPGNAFVSDLDSYDELAARLAENAPESELEELARKYWRRLTSLADVLAYYGREGDALVTRGARPPGLPHRLERVEVLLTTDVATTDIQQV